MSGEATPTRARIRLHAAMNLGMSLQVMLTHERILAVDAAILSIPEMRLHVRFDVFLPPKAAMAVGISAHPSAAERVRTTDICRNVFRAGARILDSGFDIKLGC